MATPFTAGAIVYAKDLQRLAQFYATVTGLEIVHAVDDHVVLESETHELVIVAIPAAIAQRIDIATPPVRRENTALKLSFLVASLADARAAARQAGGDLNPPDKEWSFQGLRACDGCDPEGNMIQLREATADTPD